MHSAKTPTVVNDVSDYCATNSDFHASLVGNTIHIVREKPKAVSRCMCVVDLTFALSGVAKGSYEIVYEAEPYVSDAGAVKIASANVVVP